MKRLLLLAVACIAVIMVAVAQDARLAGVWKYHEGGPVEDEFIKIDIDGSQVFVSIKRTGVSVEGKPFQSYSEVEDIQVHHDGSISFKSDVSKHEFDKDNGLYWTCCAAYSVKYAGGRLNVTYQWNSFSESRTGRLIKDQSLSPEHRAYFNINDKW